MKQMHFPWKIQEYIQRGGYNQKVTLKKFMRSIYLNRRKEGRRGGRKGRRKKGKLEDYLCQENYF